MTDNITNAQIKKIVGEVQDGFDPSNTTRQGHTKFFKFQKGGVDFAWKEGKELQVEIAGVKLPVSKIDIESVQNLLDNMTNVTKLAGGFPQLVPKKKTSKSVSFD